MPSRSPTDRTSPLPTTSPSCLPPTEPPTRAFDLAAGRRARRRNQAARSVILLTVAATLSVSVVLAIWSIRSPEHPTPAASPSTPSPVHTPPTSNSPVPAADLPRLSPQPNCQDRQLKTALGTAASQALAAKVAELVGAGQVEPDTGNAQQGCIQAGAYRQVFGSVTGSSVTGRSINFGVEVTISTYADPAPTNKTDACTPTPFSCDLSTLPDGRTVAQYELDTSPDTPAANNLHVDIWYSSHLAVRLTALPTGAAAGHDYGLDRAERIAIVTDPQLIDVARQATAD